MRPRNLVLVTVCAQGPTWWMNVLSSLAVRRIKASKPVIRGLAMLVSGVGAVGLVMLALGGGDLKGSWIARVYQAQEVMES